ncbi:carboxymethylenebutenolidase [Sphingomonas sp. LH128]|uniref:Carboxymethylenebutenolidase n=1 Tax=Novosphingobium resinovorum TaxID=158500 RepID=A0A031JRR2_9SPHN|nr:MULTISPECIES: dienelactone hydrolase family protein [Sphingomonadaceae]EJU09983.1 carboxymethylenebutenolidase [Sphingomonas sp. LH128]EZP79478.1 Carboxymethylenebutenolidase [Novosphingobium resinovorum]
MCDDYTADDFSRMDRRAFSVLGAGLALTGCGAVAAESGGELTERMVSITTADGVCDAFFVHPGHKAGGGKHPGIVMWPDIAGLRDAKKIMARNLAAQGYAVLVVNPYYRSGPAPVMKSFAEYRTPEGQAKVGPMRAMLTPEAITRDATAYVAFLDGQDAVDTKRGIGSNGYCMGGPFTVRTAAAVPGRVKAAVSLHGAGLVTEAPDSPHRVLGKTKASYVFAIARNDDAKQPEVKTELRKAADAAKRPAEVEVYAADHGWCVPDSPAYDPGEADRAWKAMVAVFAKL